jgi:hypothetical protein
MDLVSRTRQTSLFNYKKLPYSPLKLDCKSDQDPTWTEVIIALLKYGHIWESNTLLAIYLRHGRPTGPDLLRIIAFVPKESDTMYHLLRITMLVSCSRSLLKQIGRSLATRGVFGRCKECALDLHSLAMDGITDPISSSQAYQEYKLLRLEFSKNNISRGAYSSKGSLEMHAARGTALKNSDYMLLLAIHEQSAHPLPNQWLDSTGASREAIARLHPHATLSEEEFHAAKSGARYSFSADDILDSHRRNIAQSHWEFGSTSTEMDPGSEPWND